MSASKGKRNRNSSKAKGFQRKTAGGAPMDLGKQVQALTH